MAPETLRKIVARAFFDESGKKLGNFPILEFYTNIQGFFSKKAGDSQSVVIENAGPSLNIKITGR